MRYPRCAAHHVVLNSKLQQESNVPPALLLSRAAAPLSALPEMASHALAPLRRYVGDDVSPDFYGWVFPKYDHVAVGTGTVVNKTAIKQ